MSSLSSAAAVSIVYCREPYFYFVALQEIFMSSLFTSGNPSVEFVHFREPCHCLGQQQGTMSPSLCTEWNLTVSSLLSRLSTAWNLAIKFTQCWNPSVYILSVHCREPYCLTSTLQGTLLSSWSTAVNLAVQFFHCREPNRQISTLRETMLSSLSSAGNLAVLFVHCREPNRPISSAGNPVVKFFLCREPCC